jgi:hypothetical protein
MNRHAPIRWTLATGAFAVAAVVACTSIRADEVPAKGKKDSGPVQVVLQPGGKVRIGSKTYSLDGQMKLSTVLREVAGAPPSPLPARGQKSIPVALLLCPARDATCEEVRTLLFCCRAAQLFPLTVSTSDDGAALVLHMGFVDEPRKDTDPGKKTAPREDPESAYDLAILIRSVREGAKEGSIASMEVKDREGKAAVKDLKELGTYLGKVQKRLGKKALLHLSADEHLKWREFRQVMEVCRLAGFENVGLPRSVEVADPADLDLSREDLLPLKLDVDRPEDVSVPGPVDPTAPVGIASPAPEPTKIPPPAGTGEGIGGIPGTLEGIGGLVAGPFAGRAASVRLKAVTEGGGNALSELAVTRGLEWLALHQADDGHWGLHNFNRFAHDKLEPGAKTFTCNCDPGTIRENDIAATGFALLPFLGVSVTHKPTSARNAAKDYTKVVKKGLDYLMRKQAADGSFSHEMYSHGLATIAMCEAYGLTSDPLLKTSAQKALHFIVSAQDSTGGGWRYAPKQAGDMSVTGWQFAALKTGQMAGLSVPRATLTLAEKFLDSVETAQKGAYGYVPGAAATPSMTAVALLCRQYQGLNPRNAGLLAGLEYLKACVPGTTVVYYDYYATQVFHNMGGEDWKFWNLGYDGKHGMRDTLIRRQQHNNDKKPHIEGSWPPEQAPEGGRIMATSLSLLCLEVYYRHPPLYRRDEKTSKEKPEK